ncbi:MAG TPA: PIG-L family deacetylase [Candidatus Acidoferrales bacterium]|nr:PIG-L family deacetylase [Candidatus Acidoferrales bacterium]
MKMRWGAMLAAAAAVFVSAMPGARAQSVAEVVNAIDHARVVTRVLYVDAHPDDERSSVLTYLSKGLGDDVALCSTTRGEGGQNAIGPELGPALEILRTDELYRATQGYGAKLFFTRASDFGYSKSAEETLKIWHGVATEDLVRIIRTFRPDIVINQWGGVHSGHGQHQATGIVVPQAVKAASDASAYPEQLKEGLRPWRVGRVLQFARFFGNAASNNANDQEGEITLPVGEISPLWGDSYSDLGLIGFANHRSQGITRILDSSFFSRPVDLKVVEGDRLTSVDLVRTLASLGVGSNPLHAELGTADASLEAAREEALRLDWPGAVKSLAAAGNEITKAMSDARSSSVTDGRDVLWRLNIQRDKVNAALAAAAALHVNAKSERGALVAGEDFSVRVNWEARPNLGVELNQPTVEMPKGWSATTEKPQGNRGTSGTEGAQTAEASFRVVIPNGATRPTSPEDAILPWPAPLVKARITGTADGYNFSVEKPVTATDYTSTTVETMPLELVPAVTLSVDPEQVMLPASRKTKPFQLLTRVRYHGAKAAHVTVGLDVPAGWSVERVAPLDFTGAGDRLVRFAVTPSANSPQAAYDLKPYARLDDESFRTSYEALPSLPSRHVSEPAVATAHVLELNFPPHLRVGYIAAGIDPVPQSLQQLGINVDMLDEAALEFGDLSRYDAIVVGIRAYELRPDVMSANRRLLDYAEHGGTLIVQYERDFSWNKLLPAPFSAKMDQPAERITDENSPVRFADPSSSLLNYPNRITQDDFQGWIQERGLYFWGQWGPQYHAVLAMHDPGESDALGGLVYARDGKGIYIYTGIAFFRQLPAGVPGAYRLFVNLLSASQAPSAER